MIPYVCFPLLYFCIPLTSNKLSISLYPNYAALLTAYTVQYFAVHKKLEILMWCLFLAHYLHIHVEGKIYSISQ